MSNKLISDSVGKSITIEYKLFYTAFTICLKSITRHHIGSVKKDVQSWVNYRTLSLAALGLYNQQMLLQTEKMLQCQKWSSYKGRDAVPQTTVSIM